MVEPGGNTYIQSVQHEPLITETMENQHYASKDLKRFQFLFQIEHKKEQMWKYYED